MLLVPIDSNVKRYIRKGENANSGANQQDALVVDKNGNIDMNARLIWDFDRITSLTAYPIDDKTLYIRGGHFTTKNNTGNADDNYMRRGIHVNRSNTVIDGIYHEVTGEGTQGASYTGFLFFENCANVTLQDSTLCGHKGYKRPSQPSTTRGTYDIQANRTVNLTVKNCTQLRSITDGNYWGIFASNYSKNILFDGVTFSRFDAHMGVYNTTILNSKLGHQGVSIIGSGTLRIENTEVSGSNFIYFRDDYGSTWEGDLVIRNCRFSPGTSTLNNNSARIIHVNNDGTHDFGYPCFMPKTVRIEGFTVVDSGTNSSYNGVYLVGSSTGTNASTATGNKKFTLTETIYISGFIATKTWRFNQSFLTNNITVVKN
jgi:hypothetical protein